MRSGRGVAERRKGRARIYLLIIYLYIVITYVIIDSEIKRVNNPKELKMKKVYFDGVTDKYGAYVQGACVTVSDDYTMTELVRAIKAAGYKAFMTSNMSRLAKVPENI